MKRITLQWVRKILSLAGTKLTHGQAQYKKNFDKAVRTLPSFEVGQEVFLDRPPDFSATPLENENGQRKLLPKTTGPYRVINAAPDQDSVTIERDDLLDTVSINRVTKTPQPSAPEASSSERSTPTASLPHIGTTPAEPAPVV